MADEQEPNKHTVPQRKDDQQESAWRQQDTPLYVVTNGTSGGVRGYGTPAVDASSRTSGARHYARQATLNYWSPAPRERRQKSEQVAEQIDVERIAAARLASVDPTSHEYVILEGRTTVGARKDNDIVLDDAKASDIHCVFISRPRRGIFAVKDQGSTHGTFVNGEDIGIGEVATLGSGDRITLGDTAFVQTLLKPPNSGS